MSDQVILAVGGTDFKVPKDFLAKRSPVFASMFSKGWEENLQKKVDILDTTPEAFQAFLRAIVEGYVSPNCECL